MRLVLWGGAIMVGIVSVAFAWAANRAQEFFTHILFNPWLALALTPAGFMICAWAARTVFAGSQGSGIPQAIAARHLKDDAARSRLLSLRLTAGKILLTLAGLACGASIGREGPTVQVGASIMLTAARLGGLGRERGLILAGSAAGVSAAFNTPLAGIVFAIEEMSRSFEARASGLIIAAVILAGLVAESLLGNYTYFGFTSASLPIGTAWMAVPICGVVGGFSGALFSRILTAVPDALPGRTLIRRYPVIFAALCGLGVALCGLLGGGAVFGTGYEQARAVLHGTGQVPLDYAPLKLLATALSSVAGVPGGIFSPSLSVGAGIGADVARFFHNADPGPIVLLGMVAYFTGVVRAPITAFVIVSEMTGDHGMLVALMAAALIADFCARAVNREGIYHMLSRRYLAGAEQKSPVP